MFELGTVGDVLANEMGGRFGMLMSSKLMTVTAKDKSRLFKYIIPIPIVTLALEHVINNRLTPDS